jgi:hypothetical protein
VPNGDQAQAFLFMFIVAKKNHVKRVFFSAAAALDCKDDTPHHRSNHGDTTCCFLCDLLAR